MINLWTGQRLLSRTERGFRKMMGKLKLFSKLRYISRMVLVLIIGWIVIAFRCKENIMQMMVLNPFLVRNKIRRMLKQK